MVRSPPLTVRRVSALSILTPVLPRAGWWEEVDAEEDAGEEGEEGFAAGYVQLFNASDSDEGDDSDTEGWATPEVNPLPVHQRTV
jgi:hypothetical protein